MKNTFLKFVNLVINLIFITISFYIIKFLLFYKYDVNVVIIDWQKDAGVEVNGSIYVDAVNNSKKIGLKTAEIIKKLKIDPTSDIHCIGHSLGAHLCGFCGKVKKLNRISGKNVIYVNNYNNNNND